MSNAKADGANAQKAKTKVASALWNCIMKPAFLENVDESATDDAIRP